MTVEMNTRSTWAPPGERVRPSKSTGPEVNGKVANLAGRRNNLPADTQ
jgi:hypothetical protein